MTMQTSRFSIVHFRDIERWIPLRTIFDSKKIPLSWSVVSVSDIVSQVEERVKVEKDKEYKLIGVKWYGEGTFHRETVLGSETSATYLHPVIPNALIYNRLFAWKKSFALVPQELRNHFVSGEFPQFIADENKVLPRFLYLFFNLEATIKAVNMASIGSAAVSRNRFKEEDFLKFKLPLPPLDEQRRIIAAWQKAQEKRAEKKENVRRMKQETENLFLRELGINLIDNAISKVRFFVMRWRNTSRWDIEFAKNLDNQFASSKYPNLKISDVIYPLHQTTRRLTPAQTPKKIFNYIGMENVEPETGKLVDFSQTEGFEIKSSCTIFDSEHILYGKLRPYLRKVITPSKFGLSEGVASSEFLAIKNRDNVLIDFLEEYLRSKAVAIQAKQAIGARMPRISPASLLEFSIPIPPLDVQKEIMCRVEEGRSKIRQEQEAAAKIAEESERDVERMILGLYKANYNASG